jgi:hypothetical protein
MGGTWQGTRKGCRYGHSPGPPTLSLFPPAPSSKGAAPGFTQERDMGNPSVLSVTGTVKIEHRLSQTAMTIKRTQERITQQKQTLCAEQAAKLDAVESSLLAALANARLSMQLFQSVRVVLRPMDAAEQRLIEEFVECCVVSKTSART